MGGFFGFMFGTFFVGIGIVVLLVLGIVRLFRTDADDRGASSADETRMIQEMYQGFSRLEQRVETLETLLMEQEDERKGR